MVFSIFIGFVIVLLLLLVVKVHLQTNKLIKSSNNKQLKLKQFLNKEKQKNLVFTEQVSFVDAFNRALLSRFLEINRELLDLYKMLLR